MVLFDVGQAVKVKLITVFLLKIVSSLRILGLQTTHIHLLMQYIIWKNL